MRARSFLVVGAVALVVAGGAGPVDAGARPTGFVGVAAASGGRLTFTVPEFAVVEDVIDGGGPVAQSVLDSGTATSFASLPYPGDTAIAFPGLFNAASGQDLPAGYPFYVQASHPTVPEARLADPSGSYALDARAASGGTGGAARFGREGDGDGGRSRVRTDATEDGEVVRVTAETVDEALSLGNGALQIAAVRSRAETTWRAGEASPSSTTELVVQGGSAGDYTFGFGPGGLVVASQGAPIPVTEGMKAINQVLAPAGISLHFIAAEGVAGGAAADTFEIAVRRPASGQGIPGAVVRLRFGGALAAIHLGQAS